MRWDGYDEVIFASVPVTGRRMNIRAVRI